MNAQLFNRKLAPGGVLLCLFASSAASDSPDQLKADCQVPDPVAVTNSDQSAGMPEKVLVGCDDSNPATNDRCVAGACVNEPIVTCPCAEEYAAAGADFATRRHAIEVAVFNMGESDHISTDDWRWRKCATPGRRAGSLAAIAIYGELHLVFEVEARRKSRCKFALWSATDLSFAHEDWVCPYDHCEYIRLGQQDGLSEAEVSACAALIRAAAMCAE